MSSSGSQQLQRRLLITAGPTHEPIDAVRYIANRSSGRLGVALADEAARLGWRVTMLLGPSSFLPEHSSVDVHRFQTTADLHALLTTHFPLCDTLIMAAAVADFRPVGEVGVGKIERAAEGLQLVLEPTPDLVKQIAKSKRPDQNVVGFALAPAESLHASAKRKLREKGLDAIIANPLQTMDANEIEGRLWLVDREKPIEFARGTKTSFASWLVREILPMLGKN